MGQKVNPHGIRVGVIKGWDTQWYADKKNFSAFLKEDYEIRTFVKEKYYAAAISRITIERAANRIAVTIYTARPGVLIGKQGAEIEVIKNDLSKIAKGKQIGINIIEVKKPDCDAQLVAESIAAQLEKRASFRRCMKQAISRAMRLGAKGVKAMVSGRGPAVPQRIQPSRSVPYFSMTHCETKEPKLCPKRKTFFEGHLFFARRISS